MFSPIRPTVQLPIIIVAKVRSTPADRKNATNLKYCLMWTMAEVPGVIVLDDEGVERLAIARLYGGITSGDPSDPQAMSPPKEKIDKYIWRVPYEIGARRVRA